MKRILLVFAIMAGSVFMAAPATAADDAAAGGTVAESTESGTTTEAAPEPAAAPAAEEAAPESVESTDSTESAAPESEPAAVRDDASAETPNRAPSTDAKSDAVVIAAAPTAPAGKVAICHSTSAVNNPYVVNKPNASGDLNGHAGHTGPVFNDTMQQGDDWGDIIPPIPAIGFPGLNWTTAGQAIYNNGCNIPGAPDEEVTPEAPSVIEATCDADGSIVLPETEGVIYEITPAFNGPGDYIVTAEADTANGFVLAPGSTTAFPVTVDEQLSGDDCDGPKLTICHATAATTNPYVSITIAIPAVHNAHDSVHTGPIFDPITEAPGWGDIIPPYTFNGTDYPGQNWTLEGQAVLRNGCEPVDIVDTPLTNPSFVLLDQCTGDVVDVNTDGFTQIVPVAGDGGYTWEFTKGDGQTGAWTLEFTPKDGFDFGDDAVQSISGNAGSQADCEEPEEDAVLPDTGGSSPWILLMGVGLTVGGVLLLSARASLGLAGSGPVGAPTPAPMTWTQEVLTTRELKTHRGESRRRGWSWILTGKRS